MIFSIATKVTDPMAIMPSESRFNNDQSFSARQLTGKFRHVFPTTWHEIKVIRGMKHRVEKFAPASNGGILITEEAFQNLTGRGDV
jgi:hypothetical protein